MTPKSLLLTTTKWASAAVDLALGERKGPRILIYHQVGEPDFLEMNVGVETFESQLKWLLSHGDIVELDQAVEMIGMPGDEMRYVLTFDDGHLSVYETAYPLLKSNGVPFTVYLTTAPLETGTPLHDDRRMPMTTWDQVREMIDSGLVTIGAHSHRHLDMRSHSEEIITEDLRVCNAIIEERLAITPRHFAYPWGHWSDAADAFVRASYDTATIGSGRGIITPDFDIYRLPRVPVMASDSNHTLFRRKMWGGFRLETFLRGVKDRLGSQRSG